jgi:hypothetical protein
MKVVFGNWFTENTPKKKKKKKKTGTKTVRLSLKGLRICALFGLVRECAVAAPVCGCCCCCKRQEL